MEKKQYIEKIAEIINGISDTWLLEQIYRCAVNITKDQNTAPNISTEEIEYDGIMMENSYNLKNASTALQEILDQYDWNYQPNARKAVEYGCTVHPERFCDEEAKRSWEYVVGYKRIMWLVSIARDYCFLALESCESALERGGTIKE